jgi:hypothetical protein
MMLRLLKLLRRKIAAGSSLDELAALPPTRRDPPPMPQCRPTRDADFWDVGRAAEQQEPRCVEYRFLGITGLEEE